jgi:hypothetical protein
MSSGSRMAVAVTIAIMGTAGGATSIAQAAGSTTRPIHPEIAVTVAGITCQAGVALRQGTTVYLGIPASCAGPQPGQVQDGCQQAEAPIGAPATVTGARHRGTLVYNSFTRMQLAGTTNAARCDDDDLALIRLNKADRHLVAGAIPGVNAPTAVSHHGPAAGSTVRLGSGNETAQASTESGWVYNVRVYGSLPASDVGEPLVQSGHLMGMLTVLPSLVPLAPKAEVYNLHRALVDLRRAKGFHHVVLIRAGAYG